MSHDGGPQPSNAERAALAALAAHGQDDDANGPRTRSSELAQATARVDQALEAVTLLRAELQEEREARAAAQAEALRLRATAGAAGEGSGSTPVGNMVDANALVDAMRSMNVREPAIDKGKLPTWEYSKGERFATFERRVELWLQSHGVQHLLNSLPTGPESSVHDKAMAIVCLALPPYDLDYVKPCTSLKEIWASLRAKYMPSKEAEIRALWGKLNRAKLNGHRSKQVADYCSFILSIVNQLEALGAAPQKYQISNKLF